MSVSAGSRAPRATSQDTARKAFFLGLVSPVLLVAGFGWIPFGWPLGALTALASLVYGVRTFRQPRARGSTWLAAAGIVLALLVLTVFLWISISFTIDPPE
jgi:hypothetical protein